MTVTILDLITHLEGYGYDDYFPVYLDCCTEGGTPVSRLYYTKSDGTNVVVLEQAHWDDEPRLVK